jgi:hypothetical protein
MILRQQYYALNNKIRDDVGREGQICTKLRDVIYGRPIKIYLTTF